VAVMAGSLLDHRASGSPWVAACWPTAASRGNPSAERTLVLMGSLACQSGTIDNGWGSAPATN